MNIKLKAALETAGLLVAVTAVVASVKFALTSAVEAYGDQAVINGLTFGLLSVTAYVIVGLLYDMRVAQLQRLEILNKMVDKSAK